jgi:glucans biosynthesis protein C
MDRRPRLHQLDNLRAFVIVLVVVLHAAITYMTPAPTWWYVIDPDQSVAFTLLVLLVDVPLMPIMFFVAGYLATPSIRRRGPRGFLREKTIRLGIPWALGVVFLAPLATYMTYVSRSIPTGYLQFWTNDFWGPMFQQSVYWFLGVLFVAFLVFVYAYVFPARELLQADAPAVTRPGPAFFLGFIALTAGGSTLLSVRAGLDEWQAMGWLLVIQPARVAFYVGYFMLGVHAERRGWLTDAGYRPNPLAWVLICVASAAVYLAFRVSATLQGILERLAASTLFSIFCLAALLAGLAMFERWGNGAGRAWRTLAANSFGVYYIHPLILYPLAWVLVGVGVPAVAKFATLVVVTMVVSLAVSALVLRRAPGLRRMF